MAVKVPGYTKSTIRFNYMTPGLKEGLIISGVSIILLLTCIAYFNIKRKRDVV